MDQEKSFIDIGPPGVDISPPPRVDIGPPEVDIGPSPGDFYDETDKHFLPFRGVENDTPAYLPLNPKYKEIRYIAVDPGTGDSPLSCFLGYINLRRKRKSSRKIQYQAVSYHWGPIDDTVEITLRCAQRKSASVRSPRNAWRAQPYRVTRNLEGLLRAFRHQVTHRILWIDAICINQSDAAEKTHQVGAMGSIYSAASTVLVWLGEADLFSEIVIQTRKVWSESRFERIGRPADHIYWFLLGGRKLGQLIVDGYPFTLHNRKTHEGSKWLLDLTDVMRIITHSVDQCFSRPWFRRIWVLQEILLAPTTSNGLPLVTVYIGQSHMEWNELVDYAEYLGQKAQKAPTYSYYKNLDFFEEIWSQITALPEGQTRADLWLEDYLSLTTAFTASDPRDRLFAILQLAQDTRNIFKTNELLRPDYSKTLAQVLTDYRRWELGRFCRTLTPSINHEQLARSLPPPLKCSDVYDALSDDSIFDSDDGKPEKKKKKMSDQLALDYLIGPGMPKPATLEPDMPSWATNVLDGRGNIHVAENFLNRYALYNASGALPPLQNSTISSHSISLRGHYIGQIREAHTPSLTQPHQLKDLGNYLYKHRRNLWTLRQPESAPHKGTSLALKKIHRDAIDAFGREQVPQKLSARYLANRRKRNKSGGLHPGSFEPYLSNFSNANIGLPTPAPFTIGDPSIRRTRLYTTDWGEFVLTSENAKKGDIIVIIFGGRTPLLLRPLPRKNDEVSQQYKFLGACFFYRDKWMLGKEADAGLFQREFYRFFELV